MLSTCPLYMVNHFHFGRMSNTKEFSSYILDGPIILKGGFTDSKGERLDVTDSMLDDIYSSLNEAAPLLDIHDGKEPIGRIQKFIRKSDGIYQKSIINDVKRFESRYNDGHCFISPEIEVVDGKAKLTAAALTNRPGMVDQKPMIQRFYFEAPEGTPAPKAESPSWQEPLGELKNTISNLNNTLSTFGEQVKGMTNTPPQQSASAPPIEQNTKSAEQLTLSVDDLAKLVNDAVEKRIAAMQSPKTPEASETTHVQTEEPTQPSDELAKKYADMMGELDNLKKTQEKAYLKQYNALVAEMKTLGINDPNSMVPDGLSTEQKITILESIKENFAKNSPMSAPLQDHLAGSPNGSKKPGAVTIDDVLSVWDDQFGSTNSEYGSIRNDPAMRRSLSKLADADLMMKYNLPVLYDSNGNYIGPV